LLEMSDKILWARIGIPQNTDIKARLGVLCVNKINDLQQGTS
jgi:hypothetical protein